MSRRLLLAGAVALSVSGCAPAPVATVRTVVERCPTELPLVPCPPWPADAPRTLLDLEQAYAEGKAAHAACRAALDATTEAWAACGVAEP